jgi:uncharacterized protein (TIGR03032 family)
MTETPKLEINASRNFTRWLAEQNCSIAFSTYQAGKLFLIGLDEQGKMSVFERSFARAMGLHVHEKSLYLATLYQIWRFHNMSEKGQAYHGYDGVYVPQMSVVTGDCDVHDIAVAKNEQLYFANTLFSCVAESSATHSFRHVWKPEFISKLAAEDRCHLNGLALRDGWPRYVTTVSQTDVHEGWREHRRDGGLVMDMQSDEIILDGLSMPHSPRWHDDHLWVLNSGKGELLKVDVDQKTSESICFAPGYARGLALQDDYAVFGLSKPRHNKSFNGLELNEILEEEQVSPRCGLQVVNLRTGDSEHTLSLEGIVEEIYDVAILPNVRRPMAIGFKNTEIEKMISIENA